MESSIHVLLMNVIIIVFPFHGYKSKAFACTAEGSFDCLPLGGMYFPRLLTQLILLLPVHLKSQQTHLDLRSYLHQVSDLSLLHWLVIRIIDQRFNFLFLLNRLSVIVFSCIFNSFYYMFDLMEISFSYHVYYLWRYDIKSTS